MFYDENARYSIDELIPLIRECIESGHSVKMRVTGMSMQPLFFDRRDTVVLERADEIKKYDIVLHERANGHYILHRVLKVKGELLDIAGDFESQKEKNVHVSQVIARVTAFERNGIYHRADERKFMLYAVLWGILLPVRFPVLKTYRAVRRCLNAKGKKRHA